MFLYLSITLFNLYKINIFMAFFIFILFDITNQCDKFKNNKNITLLLLFIKYYYFEIKWIQSGLKVD
jgi:glucan phosphoethanolaminetransferase (alkaline phosphatase superfamily)